MSEFQDLPITQRVSLLRQDTSAQIALMLAYPEKLTSKRRVQLENRAVKLKMEFPKLPVLPVADEPGVKATPAEPAPVTRPAPLVMAPPTPPTFDDLCARQMREVLHGRIKLSELKLDEPPAVKDGIAPPPPIVIVFDEEDPIPYRHIVEIIADLAGTTIGELKGPRRHSDVAKARHACWWLLRKHRADLSFPRIGSFFGGRDHSTILLGVRNVDRNPDKYAGLIKAAEEQLGGVA